MFITAYRLRLVVCRRRFCMPKDNPLILHPIIALWCCDTTPQQVVFFPKTLTASLKRCSKNFPSLPCRRKLWSCHNTSTIETCYWLIPPCESDIVKPSIPSKTRLCTSFGSTMIKYAFMLPPPKVGVKGKSIQIHTTVQESRCKYQYRQA